VIHSSAMTPSAANNFLKMDRRFATTRSHLI
jgi:hypothetical protein